jgi:RND family efflux transporter MFP subunit
MKALRVLVVLAVVGALAALLAIRAGTPPPATTAQAPIAAAPFASFVAGAGLTETGRGNVAVGTPVAGVVAALLVRVGDRVAAGDPLFRVDDRDLQAQLAVARAEVAQAAAALDKPRHRLGFLASLQGRDRGAISAQALSEARDDARAAEAALALAQARVHELEVAAGRAVVRAPVAGRVLQVNTRVGEYVSGGGQGGPLLLLGDDTRTYLRVDVDESDAWRVRPGARALAYVRGNPALATPLRFEYIEPYVAPKATLTGQAAERTDVRVLQVVYSFPRDAVPVYLGEQMDVYIEAPPAPAARTR